MFERILIANRGEVAARVARTCRRLGIETVSVHVEHEADDVHVEACDESICLGSDPALYRDVQSILDAARRASVHAVHPGYGLARDEVALARALEAENIVYVGPSAEKLAVATDRLAVRAIAADLGVRVLPGSERPILEPNDALAEIDRIGYPVYVERVRSFGEAPKLPEVQDVAALSEALESLGPLEAFGGALIERWIERARHVEVQLLFDGTESLVLGDREVSLNRGGRLLGAEAPALAVSQLHRADAVRGAIWEAATEITTALGCRGLSSCRFVLDGDGVFYFAGFVPLLTVEHSTIEMCLNLDLVELSLSLAAGEPTLPDVYKREPSGCAMSARVDASIDPRSGLPFESRVDAARWPPAPQGKVRIETGVKVGSQISPEHDPLVASVTTYAPTRHDALLMLDRILAEIQLSPVVTNLRLLRKALNHESLRAGQYDDGFLDRI